MPKKALIHRHLHQDLVMKQAQTEALIHILLQSLLQIEDEIAQIH